MRPFFKIIYLSILIYTFAGCSKEYEVPQELVVYDFVWKGLNAYYLYQDEITDLADTRFNSDQQLNTYLNTFTEYNTLFSNLLIPTDIKSNLIEDYNTIVDSELRSAYTNGLEFGIIAEPNHTENVIGYVTHILPNSDASRKDIKRGDFFNVIDGLQLTRTNYQDILLNGLDNLTLKTANFDGTIVTPNPENVVLEKQNYNYPATFLEKKLIGSSDDIGYLMYNNDFSKNYINDLNNTFLSLENQNINELILDLRYNIGGGSFVKNISQISSMITGQFAAEVLIKEKWNAKAQPWFIANQPDSLVTKFPESLNATTNINSLNLTDVYIILNGDNFKGSSAIELLINSLKAHINVHIIGNQTLGNNTGSITLYNSEDYNFPLRNNSHTAALQPIVLSFLNKDGQTYENGFLPNIALCTNEDVLNLGVLGEISDPILNSIINYISTGNAGTNNICNPNNFEYLYNSIGTQREIDKGVFIHQDLPNTN